MFKNVKAQTEKMNDLITRAESLVNTAESEKRELTEAEAQNLPRSATIFRESRSISIS